MGCKQSLLLGVFVLFMLSAPLHAAVPLAFKELGNSLERDLQQTEKLAGHDYFAKHRGLFTQYAAALDTAFETGRILDGAVEMRSDDVVNLKKRYLQQLRAAEKVRARIHKTYYTALNHAMKDDDRVLFELLITHPMEPLENRHVRERFKNYYESKAQTWKFAAADALGFPISSVL